MNASSEVFSLSVEDYGPTLLGIGAFVGAIFGGLSPLEAGRFQIIVLAAIMAAGAITAVLIGTGLGAVRQKPAATGN